MPWIPWPVVKTKRNETQYFLVQGKVTAGPDQILGELVKQPEPSPR